MKDGLAAHGDLDALAGVIAGVLAVPTVMISRFGDDRQNIVGAHGLPNSLDRVRIGPQVSPLCRHVLTTARPAIVHDARRRLGHGGLALSTIGVAGYAGVPVFSDGRPVGVLAAIDQAVRAWTARDIDVLRSFAEIVAAILDRQDEARRTSSFETALDRERELTAALLRATGSGTVTETLESLARYAGSRFTDLVVLDASGLIRLHTWCASAAVHAELARDEPWPAESDPLVCAALRDGEPVWSSSRADEAASTWTARAADLGLQTVFAVAVPGRSAVLELLFEEHDPPRTDIIRAATVVAALLRSRLELTDKHVEDRRTAELEIIALHDDLTGLLNRRGLYAIAESQLVIARRQRFHGLLVFVDLDGLKTVNDRDGHAAGDDVLRAAAGALRRVFREVDTIGRIGGDEFVALATDLDEADVTWVTDRLADELSHVNQQRAPSPPVEWSLGLVPFAAAEARSLDWLMAEADSRMYAAKRHTRRSP